MVVSTSMPKHCSTAQQGALCCTPAVLLCSAQTVRLYGYFKPGNMELRSILFISFIMVMRFSWPPSCCIMRGSMQP